MVGIMHQLCLHFYLFVLYMNPFLNGPNDSYLSHPKLNLVPDGDVINTGWYRSPMFTSLISPFNGAIFNKSACPIGQVSMQNPVAPGTYTAVCISMRLKKAGNIPKKIAVDIVVKGTPLEQKTITVNSTAFEYYKITWKGLNFTQREMNSLEVFFKATDNTRMSVDHIQAELYYVPANPQTICFPQNL